MKIVYLDILLALDFSCDFLILSLASRIGGVSPGLWRRVLAAGVSAVMSAGIYFVELSSPFSFLLRLLPGAVMSMICAGVGTKKSLRFFLLVCALTAASGGAVFALGAAAGGRGFTQHNGVFYADVPMRTLIAGFLAALALLTAVFGRGRGDLSRGVCAVRVKCRGKEAGFNALLDSGNLLRDPVTGKRVMLASPEALEGIFSKRTQFLLKTEKDPCRLVEVMRAEEKLCFRLIPYVTAVGEGGMIAAFTPDEVSVNGKKQTDWAVGICDIDAGGCPAIMGV